MGNPKFKRLVVIADLHCGHRVGMTFPKYQSQIKGRKYHRIQVETCDWYKSEIDKLKPIDVLAVDGDCVEGGGQRSGKTELITADYREQRMMAVEAITYPDAPSIIIARGTAYHVSPDGQDQEDGIADELKKKKLRVKIGDHEFFNINGVIFDMKHHIGTTQTPYSKLTAISKDQLWNLIWNDYKAQPRADILLRAHTHTYVFGGDSSWFGVGLPALQAMGSKFGARKMSKHIDFGIFHFDIYKDGSWTWTPHILDVQSQKATVTRF